MTESLSVKYGKAVQLLQKKKEELERVFDEARALEAENATLAAQNRELKSRNLDLESATKSMSFEFAALESQVKKQQARLQYFIDLEAAGNGTGRPRPVDVQKQQQLQDEVSELRRKLMASEEALRKATDAQSRLQSQCDAATIDLRQLRAQLTAAVDEKQARELELRKLEHQLSDSNKRVAELQKQRDAVAQDSHTFGTIEAEALLNLRREVATITAENHKLMDQLEDERAQVRELRAEVDHFDEVVRKQRFLSDGQLKICRDEVSALNAQNEALLSELRRAAVEREQLKKAALVNSSDAAAATKVTQQAATSPAPSGATSGVASSPRQRRGKSPSRHDDSASLVQPRTLDRPPTVSRGSMTVEVYSPPSKVAMVPAAELDAAQKALGEKTVALQQLQADADALARDRDALNRQVSQLETLIAQKDETLALREKKEELLAVELERTQIQLQKARSSAASISGAQATGLDTAPQYLGQHSADGASRVGATGNPAATGHHTRKDDVVIVPADLDEVDEFIAKLLVAATQAYRTSSAVMDQLGPTSSREFADDAADGAGTGASSSSEFDDFQPARPDLKERSRFDRSGIVPVVPCNRFRAQVLNRIMQQLGGLRFVVKAMLRSLKWMMGRLASVNAPASLASAAAPPLVSASSTARPAFDVDQWIAARRQGGNGPTVPHIRPSEYTAGTTLLDVVEELRRSPGPSLRRR